MVDTSDIMLYSGALLITLWGAAHIAVTRAVVKGFGPISEDNKRIFTQEWIAEGLTMIFIALLVASVNFFGEPGNPMSVIVYRLSSLMLIVVAILTALTGARTPIIQFKICPVFLTANAVLIFLGGT